MSAPAANERQLIELAADHQGSRPTITLRSDARRLTSLGRRLENDLGSKDRDMLRTIGILTVIGLLILGVGFGAGWFTFGSETHAGETELKLRVDREELRSDIDDVKSSVGNGDDVAVAPADTVPAGGTMTGDVLSVEPTASKLKLRLLSGDERTLVVAAESAAGLYTLKPGDRVELTTVVEDGRARIVALRVL